MSKTAEKSKRWRDRNPMYFKMRNRAYYQANYEREKARRELRAKTHPEERRTINRNSRARRRKAKGRHTKFDVERLFNKQNGLCVGIDCCAILVFGYHVDHKTPLSRGGSNWSRNLQLLCPSCNDSKGTKTMREWILTRQFSRV